jgi:Immunity protein 22
MQKATHKQFRVGGVVSLWLGNFESEDMLDIYLDEQFENDFGFKIYPPDGPEADIEDEAVDICTLLNGYSRSASFVDVAVTAALAKGWNRATTAVVFYNFQYDVVFISPNIDAPITFIGVLPYGGFG